MISEITGEVLYDRIQRHSLLIRVQSICYEIFVPSGIASRLRTAPEGERRNPLTFYTIYYIDGGLGGGHLTPKLVGFLDPLDREFFETFTTVPGVGFMRALKSLIRPLNEIALAIERGDAPFLKELPYIGTKTSERIITELKGKMAKFALSRAEEPLSVEQESAAGLYSGDILFEEKLCEFKDIKQSENLGIGIIHQELALISTLSIAENIFLGNERATKGIVDWNETTRFTVELLEKVGLNELPNTLVKNISVGKQQLVEIAKALSKEVKLLILDEPTAALNEADSNNLLDLILGLKSHGITSILISHKLNEIEKIADSITILRDGATIETLDTKKR